MASTDKLKDLFLAVAEKACCEYHVCVEPEKCTCPDAYFGTVAKMLDKPVSVKKGLKLTPGNRIVLVLESPHVDEYKDPVEVWPIQGPSGDNVRAHLRNLLIDEMYSWGFFVVNAIRYQCSQGLTLSRGFNRSAKNFVVGNLLRDDNFRIDFIERVRQIADSSQTVVVLNACTKYIAWNLQESNKEMVSRYLGELESIRGKCFNDVSHPSYWTKEKVPKMRDKFSKFWAAHRGK